MKALKRLVKILVGVLVLLVVLLVVGIFFLDSLVEKGINTAAPALLGVNTHVDSVSIRPFKGIVQLKNLTLANPEGYTTEKKLFEVTEFYVNVNMASLFSDTIKIRKILIQGPGCTYEVKEGTSNIDALIAKLNKGASTEKTGKKLSESTRCLSTKGLPKINKKSLIVLGLNKWRRKLKLSPKAPAINKVG